ncbi:hypothetical protein A2U01_0085382, partial [Trifolium medium]|nr:hypothetical protein [Trifolium medium]
VKAVDGFVRELIRVVASFEVSQSLWWKRERIMLSLLLFVFGFGVGVGFEGCDEEKSEKCGGGDGVLWEDDR